MNYGLSNTKIPTAQEYERMREALELALHYMETHENRLPVYRALRVAIGEAAPGQTCEVCGLAEHPFTPLKPITKRCIPFPKP